MRGTRQTDDAGIVDGADNAALLGLLGVGEGGEKQEDGDGEES
jgi:hypothetical protein